MLAGSTGNYMLQQGANVDRAQAAKPEVLPVGRHMCAAHIHPLIMGTKLGTAKLASMLLVS